MSLADILAGTKDGLQIILEIAAIFGIAATWFKTKRLYHEMNSMKDALIESSSLASGLEGEKRGIASERARQREERT